MPGYDGPEYHKQCLQIDGAQRERVFQETWSFRIGGAYEARADLTRIEGGRERHYGAVATFSVVGLAF